MNKQEVESKFELSVDEFQSLLKCGVVARRDEQLNVYYDANWSLAEQSSTFRIRFHKGSAPVLTLKTPVARHGARRTMREIEFEVGPHSQLPLKSARPKMFCVADDLPEDISHDLLSLGIDHLTRVGWVRNIRLTVFFAGAGSIELDTLHLPDGSTVHEAEVDTDDAVQHAALAALICRCVPTARPSSISKFQRFRRATRSD